MRCAYDEFLEINHRLSSFSLRKVPLHQISCESLSIFRRFHRFVFLPACRKFVFFFEADHLDRLVLL